MQNAMPNLNKLLPAAGGKACFARKIFVVAKMFINSTPAMLEMFQGVLNNYSMLKLRFLINKLTFAMY